MGLWSKTPFVEPTLQPPTDRQMQILRESWHFSGSYITQHDGTPSEAMDTTLNVKDNPLLVAAIEEMRDQYFKGFNQLAQLHRHRKYFSRNRELTAMEKRLDIELVEFNRQCLERLQKPDYGFTAAKKEEILAAAKVTDPTTVGQPLSEEDSYLILRKTIGRTVEISENMLQDRDVGTPRSFDPRGYAQKIRTDPDAALSNPLFLGR